MPEPVVLLAGLLVAGAMVLLPLLRPAVRSAAGSDDADAAALRHRVALEALRDVEADRRAGSLDDAAYAEQLRQAEERAAVTRSALERETPPEVPAQKRGGRSTALLAAGAIGVALIAGSVLPATGIGNTTAINQPLADAQAAETARQERIGDLLAAFAERSDDPTIISALADEFLAGSTPEDLARAAASLQLLIQLEPERADAYERIMSAYLRAGDAANARAAHDSYATLATADPVEVAFYDGLIALRAENDVPAAIEAFDRFLELAPRDPRADMIGALRDEASQSP